MFVGLERDVSQVMRVPCSKTPGFVTRSVDHGDLFYFCQSCYQWCWKSSLGILVLKPLSTFKTNVADIIILVI